MASSELDEFRRRADNDADAARFRKLARMLPGQIDAITLQSWIKVLDAPGVLSQSVNLASFRKAVDNLEG